MTSTWIVEYTDEFEAWWNSISINDQIRIAAAVELLEVHGPNLGRPTVDTLTNTRLSNLKELRAGTTRTLFAFDRRRHAILLIGGDKSRRWNDWYRTAIPKAEDLYDQHAKSLNDEGAQ